MRGVRGVLGVLGVLRRAEVIGRRRGSALAIFVSGPSPGQAQANSMLRLIVQSVIPEGPLTHGGALFSSRVVLERRRDDYACVMRHESSSVLADEWKPAVDLHTGGAVREALISVNKVECALALALAEGACTHLAGYHPRVTLSVGDALVIDHACAPPPRGTGAHDAHAAHLTACLAELRFIAKAFCEGAAPTRESLHCLGRHDAQSRRWEFARRADRTVAGAPQPIDLRVRVTPHFVGQTYAVAVEAFYTIGDRPRRDINTAIATCRSTAVRAITTSLAAVAAQEAPETAVSDLIVVRIFAGGAMMGETRIRLSPVPKRGDPSGFYKGLLEHYFATRPDLRAMGALVL